MDRNLLKRFSHFLAVVEEGHFGRAAAKLGMSQPPLTAQIQALEHSLGVKLIERTRQGARPTWEGEVLLPAVRRLERAAMGVEILAREVKQGRRDLVTVGCITSAMLNTLPPVIRAFRAERPEAVIAVREMDTADAVEYLRRGEIDLAFARLEGDRFPLRAVPLAVDRLVVALPDTDPLAAQRQIDIAALQDRPLVMLPRAISPAYFDNMVAACRQAGFAPVPAREVNSAMAQLALVASGLGVALVSSGMATLAPPHVVFRPLVQRVEAVGVAVAWNSERDNEITREIVAIARRIAQEPGEDNAMAI
jgi:DNA-binding transcriptional LysR family regulator